MAGILLFNKAISLEVSEADLLALEPFPLLEFKELPYRVSIKFLMDRLWWKCLDIQEGGTRLSLQCAIGMDVEKPSVGGWLYHQGDMIRSHLVRWREASAFISITGYTVNRDLGTRRYIFGPQEALVKFVLKK